MATIRRETVLDAPFETVWQALQGPAVMIAVSAPLLRFRPVDPPVFPARWGAGDMLVAMRLFGVVPLGRQVISPAFEASDGPRRVLRDRGHGAMVRRWDHSITIAERADGRTGYVDEVIIEAGPSSRRLVALFAGLFYAHRQRRWHALIPGRCAAGRRDAKRSGLKRAAFSFPPSFTNSPPGSTSLISPPS